MMRRPLLIGVSVAALAAVPFALAPAGAPRPRAARLPQTAAEPRSESAGRRNPLALVSDSQIPTDGQLLADRVQQQRASRSATRVAPTRPPRSASSSVPPASQPAHPRPRRTLKPRPVATVKELQPQRGGLNWAALRECESSGNYQAVNPSGRYRGAYQFDLETWRSVGGVGDPATASPSEQDKRAWMLYLQRGRTPWPECGRRL